MCARSWRHRAGASGDAGPESWSHRAGVTHTLGGQRGERAGCGLQTRKTGSSPRRPGEAGRATRVIRDEKDDGHSLALLDPHATHALLVTEPAFSLERHRLRRSGRWGLAPPLSWDGSVTQAQLTASSDSPAGDSPGGGHGALGGARHS